jgi:lysophospholipase L1-like esterase
MNDRRSRLKQTGLTHGCEFIDLNAKFRDPDGRLPDELTPDGIHLSPAGYQRWIELLPLAKAGNERKAD